jgi:hypothetical protein
LAIFNHYGNFCYCRHCLFDYPIKQKVNTIVITLPEDYCFSSAGSYAGMENELEVVSLDLF